MPKCITASIAVDLPCKNDPCANLFVCTYDGFYDTSTVRSLGVVTIVARCFNDIYYAKVNGKH
jgi:hypothetical protein